MHLMAYQRIAEKMRNASMQAATNIMKEAAKAVRKVYSRQRRLMTVCRALKTIFLTSA